MVISSWERRTAPCCCLVLAMLVWATFAIKPLKAAEGAGSFYLLGSKTSMAGFLPPPGTYVQDLNFFYSGSSDVALDLGGVEVTGGVDANLYYKLPTLLWVSDKKIFGGNVALTAVAPIGWKDVSAAAEIRGPGGGVFVPGPFEDSGTHFGDPVVGGIIGWHRGNWHWNITTLVNIPIGYWEVGSLDNIGFNRWGFDTTAAVTWLDPTVGLELSIASGFTFHLENPDTDYKTGTEFHLEYAAVKNFSKELGIGVNGYFYQQVEGDSGAGARLGSFKGRTLALGPVVNWNFVVRQIPVSTSFKYMREFDVENCLEGDVGFVSLTMPLSAGPR